MKICMKEFRLTFYAFMEEICVHEEGQDMIEYALLAALIAVACIVVMASVGTSIQGIFTSVTSTLGGA